MSEPAPPPGMARPPLPAAAALLAAALLHCAPAAPARRHKPVSRGRPVPPSVSPAALRCCPEGGSSPADPPLNGMSRALPPPLRPSIHPSPSRARDAGTGGAAGNHRPRDAAPARPCLPGSSWLLGEFSQPCSPGKRGPGQGELRRGRDIPRASFRGSRALAAAPTPPARCAGSSQSYGETRLKG